MFTRKALRSTPISKKPRRWVLLLALIAGLPIAAWAAWGNGSGGMVYNLGRVGVGTSSPQVPLHVASSDDNIAAFECTDSGDCWIQAASGGVHTYMIAGKSQGDIGYIGTLSGHPFRIRTDNTDRISIDTSGNVGIGTTGPAGTLDVRGRACISSSGPYACPNNMMQAGSLTLGDPGLNYGGGYGWSGNTAGLMLEAQDNTELAVHDANHRLASLMYYEGGGNNRITIGRDMGWGALDSTTMHGNLTVTGNIAAKYQDIAEWVPSRKDIPAGAIVVLDTTRENTVVESSSPYDTRVAGVVSAMPGLVLGEQGTNKVKVATTGRVKVRADAASAPIKVGDILVTSDKQGTAMKSQAVNVGGIEIHRPGTIVGKALEPLAQGQGEILVLLSLQ